MIQGRQKITYGQALKFAGHDGIDGYSYLGLQKNNIDSVLGWLRGEFRRHEKGIGPETDYVSSSGSTGPAKKFLVPLAAQMVTADAINSNILFDRGLDELILLPLSHSSARGRLKAAVMRGATIQIAPHPLSLSRLDYQWMKDKTYAAAVTPSTFRYLQKRLNSDLWTVLGGLVSLEFGSAPLTQPEVLSLRENAPGGVDLLMHYGLSEASRSFIRNLRVHDWNQLGDPLPHVRFKLGRDRELLIEGSHTASAIVVDGKSNPIHTVYTGDLCQRQGSNLVLLGRKANVLNIGGMKLRAEEAEELLARQPGCEDVVVVPFPDPLLGEIPAICFVGARSKHIETGWQCVTKSLALTSVHIRLQLPTIPLLGPGKVDRLALREIVKDRASEVSR